MLRIPNKVRPPVLGDNATLTQQINHKWHTFLSKLWLITEKQHTADWFLGRLFCFTSTTFHVTINCLTAPYFMGNDEKHRHEECKNIIKISPIKAITIENAATDDDDELPPQRSGGNNSSNTAPVTQDPAKKEYWMKLKKTQLVALVEEKQLIHHLEGAYKESYAKVLAAYHSEISREQNEQQRGTQSRLDKDVAQITLLQRMLPHWFMRPFESRAGSAIAQGTLNESEVIKLLPKCIRKFSNNKFTIHKNVYSSSGSYFYIHDFGLLARRDLRACASSPDGVFVLMIKSMVEYIFFALCALEIKTRGAESTTTKLLLEVINFGTFVECNAGTDDFKKFVPDSSYRSQMCQHATALNVEYVLIVYCTPGGLAQRMVLLRVSQIMPTNNVFAFFTCIQRVRRKISM